MTEGSEMGSYLASAQLVSRITVSGGRQAEAGVFALWRDGFVAWSEDPVAGGPPYWVGWAEGEEVERRLAALAQQLHSITISVASGYFGPDARRQIIELLEGGEPFFRMSSWHELFEANSELVATDGGIEPLNGRNRAAVLATTSAEYQAFRQRWQAIKEYLLAFVPAQAGIPYDPNNHRPLPW